MMRTSARGAFALACHEGLVPGPYLDSVGVWTFGIGHTAAAGAPDPSTMKRGMPANVDGAIAEAIRLFREDLAEYEADVLRAVKVGMAQHEFDALVSFHYNTGAISRAKITAHLNAGDRAAAAAAFLGWLKPTSIKGRRMGEQALFATGEYPGGKVAVYPVNAAGGITWKPLATIGFDEFTRAFGGQAATAPAVVPTIITSRPSTTQPPKPPKPQSAWSGLLRFLGIKGA